MEQAAAQPVIPPTDDTPVAPPTKSPTAAAIRKQVALEKKIATAAQMELTQRAKEQSMRASESHPESGLTDARTDYLLSIGLRRSTRARVDGVVTAAAKFPQAVTNRVKKVVKAHANEGARGRGTRGGAKGGGRGQSARGGARGGKKNAGTRPGAKAAVAPVQQMPLFLPAELDNSELDMDNIEAEEQVAAVAAIDDSATESDPDYPVATVSAEKALEIIANTQAKVPKQRGRLRDKIDAAQLREIDEEEESEADLEYMDVEMDVKVAGPSKRKAAFEAPTPSIVKKLKPTKESGLVANWAELSAQSNKLPALLITTSSGATQSVGGQYSATPAKKTNSAAQQGRVKRLPKPEPVTGFREQVGGFPEEFDQSEERGLIEIESAEDTDEVLTSRKTSQLSVKVTHPHTSKTVAHKIVASSSDIVSVKSEPDSNDKKRKATLKDIPMFYRDRWPSHLIPLLINRIGADPKPWEPSFDGTRLLQEIRDTVYENDEHTIDEGGWVDKLAKQRVYEWRNSVGQATLDAVAAYFNSTQLVVDEVDRAKQLATLRNHRDIKLKYLTVPVFPSRDSIVDRVHYLLTRNSKGDLPFLWENLFVPPTPGEALPASKGQPYHATIIIESFSLYYGERWSNIDPLEDEYRPIGALALTLTGLERAFRAWSTGTCTIVTKSKEEKKKKPVVPGPEFAKPGEFTFSKVRWGGITDRYVTALGLMKDKWWNSFLELARAETTYADAPVNISDPIDGGDDYRICIPSSDA